MKDQNKADELGVLLKDRCGYFRSLGQHNVEALTGILKSRDLTASDKYKALLEELQKMHLPHKIEKIDGSDLFQFELVVEFDNFACVILGTEEQLQTEVMQYFNDMLLTNKTNNVIEVLDPPLKLLKL